MLPSVHELWRDLLKEVDIPSPSSWILTNSEEVIPIVKFFNSSRSIQEKESPILLQTYDFTMLYTKIRVGRSEV